MIDLCFPNYEFRIKNRHNKKYIFDLIRKKFILLTHEEWVRQNCIMFLINEQKIPKVLINVEKKIKVNNLTKRYDIIVYRPNGSVFLLVECKSPKVNINQETFNQISIYNSEIIAQYLMLTNGLFNYYCSIDYSNQCYKFVKDFPKYT
ncbi:MAG: type I restriction enzyme HsdR N-terminal domain-containing protein [Flavobacteriales bacterium]|nr:type I restriction enzyme HsdR N-terminal domain-containing protein [Flavobacteriaceae bacterium]RZP06272.1 MAG: type I restriction enzyme HsdR N-terminal domain-containing protein [Flavobacteriales bacterium]|tara:strand:- start:749 stop:1192 length:444 start_codon:yes stop_codon:yes gene_type:complete